MKLKDLPESANVSDMRAVTFTTYQDGMTAAFIGGMCEGVALVFGLLLAAVLLEFILAPLWRHMRRRPRAVKKIALGTVPDWKGVHYENFEG